MRHKPPSVSPGTSGTCAHGRDQAGGGGQGGSSPERMAMKIKDKRSGCSKNDRKDGKNQEFP